MTTFGMWTAPLVIFEVIFYNVTLFIILFISKLIHTVYDFWNHCTLKLVIFEDILLGILYIILILSKLMHLLSLQKSLHFEIKISVFSVVTICNNFVKRLKLGFCTFAWG